MTTRTSSFQLTATSAQNIIANRAIISAKQHGETLRFHVQGNGNTIAVTTKDGAQVMANGTDNVPLFKTIYGLKCNSQVAMLNPRNKEILRGAFETEQSGDGEAAHAAYNDYLNKIQVSFSVILNPGRTNPTFTNGQLVEGEVELITTENGQLLTLNNVRPVAVAKAAATPAFTLNDLMGVATDPTPDDVFTGDPAAIADKEKDSLIGG
jgi:hypothetical protein